MIETIEKIEKIAFVCFIFGSWLAIVGGLTWLLCASSHI